MMAQQEQTQRYSNSSRGGRRGGIGCCGGGTRSSKKLKQKKVLQRGFGVAQLEKIRLEEQEKKDVAAKCGGNFHKLGHQGSDFCSNVKLLSESNTRTWPLPGIMQRSEQFQRTCPSSMVNVPSGTLSSSVMNFQIEPPSNQSYHSNNYTPLWPEEERMGGIKRLYPFSIDDASGPSFNSKFPPAYASPIPRTDETASCSNDGTFNIKPAANPVLREGPSSSSGMSEPKMRKVAEENGFFDGDFLTLAPPKPKHPSSYLIPHRRELLDFDALPYQGTTNGIVEWPRPDRSIQQPFFSFLPSATTQNDQSAATISNSNGVVESIDLNLKL